MRDEPNGGLKCLSGRSCRTHERCWFIKTAGRWSWKSKAAKECVTTHLPNGLALKMDGAQATHLYPANNAGRCWVRRRGARGEAVTAVRRSGTGGSADLGVSSKYSSGSLEDRCGEGFLGKRIAPRVRRT
jgi:hypothetical protein